MYMGGPPEDWTCPLPRYAYAAVQCVCVAYAVRWWLGPWAIWLCRRALCWTRYALSSGRGAEPGGQRDSACRCCGGVDFDGLAGRWAVITGCTDGIGKQYTLQLADKGMNLVLVSRNPDKLRALEQEISDARGAAGVRTRVVVADFTSSRGHASLSAAYDAVRRGLDGLDVGLLINNAGTSYAYPQRLLDVPPCCASGPVDGGRDPVRDIVECNALAAVAMCRIVMPLMAGGRRDGTPPSATRGGVVVNVSSMSALKPFPMQTVYSASKAFLHKFSLDLANEYGDFGNLRDPIYIRCLLTGFVATKLTRMRSTLWLPSPEQYARHSLRSLGCSCGCRMSRTRLRKRGVADGWLANVASDLFESTSSPFSVGETDVTAIGHPCQTLTLICFNIIIWIIGDKWLNIIISKCMERFAVLFNRCDEKKKSATK